MKLISALLSDDRWKLAHNKFVMGNEVLSALLAHGAWAMDQLTASVSEGQCIVAVGQSGFDYLLFTLIASVLGCSVVLCDPKLLSKVLQRQKNVALVLSTRAFETNGLTNFVWSPESHVTASVISGGLSISPVQARITFATSGTTGEPKLVTYNEAVLCRNALMVGHYLKIKPGDKVLCVFPVHYMYGFSTVVNGLLAGANVVIERSTISISEIVQYIDRGLNFLPLIGRLIDALCIALEGRNANVLSGITVLNASDRLYVQQAHSLLSLGATVWNNFGQTESGPRLFALQLKPENIRDLPALSYREVMAPGYPVHPDIEVAVLDAEGNTCRHGEPGALHYQTPFAMTGYMNPDGSVQPMGAIRSGDHVIQSVDGLIYWIGRDNETTKCNGTLVNVGLLHLHFDRIMDGARTYFTLDQRRGLIKAFIQLKEDDGDNEPLAVKRIQRLIKEEYIRTFPLYPRISEIHVVNRVPRTISGKVDLHMLQNITLAQR